MPTASAAPPSPSGISPEDFKGLRTRAIAEAGLCVVVQNWGDKPVTLTEVGLTRGGDGPQIALRELMLHDKGSWPRTLAPGEEVVCHFGSSLLGHPILPLVARSYAVSIDGGYFLGDAEVLQYYRNVRTATAAA